MIIPDPAFASITFTEINDIDGLPDPQDLQFWMIRPEVSGNELIWTNSEGDITSRTLAGTLVVDGLSITGSTVNGSTIRLRDVDPYDAVSLSPAGVPQPVEAIRAAFKGGQMATELDAVVAPDNSVATLMLETSVGVYLRFGHAWQLLGPDSTALENMALVSVAAGALDVWDAGEAASQTVYVSDFPVKSGSGGIENIYEPSAPDAPVPSPGGVVIASGASIPDIMDISDLAVAVDFGQNNPASRWFVEKRAKALGAKIPDWKKTA